MKLFSLFISIIIFCAPSFSQETYPVNGVAETFSPIYALTNAHIVISSKKEIANGTILIQDGKILGVDSLLDIPEGSIIKDMKGDFIYPAFIDIYSDYGLEKIKKGEYNYRLQYKSNKDGAFHWNEAIHPEIDACEKFVVDAEGVEKYLNSGFGIVLTHQKDGISRGTAALVSLSSEPEEQSMIVDKSASVFSFKKGTSKQKYPSSLMGSIALLRQLFLDAEWYKNSKKSNNLSYNAFNDQLSLPHIFESKDVLDYGRIYSIADEFEVDFIVKGNGSEYQIVEEIKRYGFPVILPLNFPVKYNIKNPEKTNILTLSKLKHWETAPFNPRILSEHDIPFCFTMSGLKNPSDFIKNLRISIRKGLNKKDALNSLTYIPASLLGKEDMLGTLEKGKNANLIICSSDIFEDGIIYEVWTNGQKNLINKKEGQDIRGHYTLICEEGEIRNFSIEGTISKLKMLEIISDSSHAKYSITRDEENIIFSNKDLSFRGNAYLQENDFSGFYQNLEGENISFTMKRDSNFIENIDEFSLKYDTIIPDIWSPNKAYGNNSKKYPYPTIFTNATIWTNEKEGVLYNADIAIADGKIIAIGQGLIKDIVFPKVKEEVILIDATSKHITCGIIDEHSHIAISNGVNESSQAVTAEVKIGDVINPRDHNIYRQLAGGVTAAQLLHGSANPIGGQSALIKFRWGSSAEEMKIKNADGFIKFALGENVKQSNWGDNNKVRFPQTRMGVEQVFYDAFYRAKEYEREWDAYNSISLRKKRFSVPPRQDLELDALLEIINSKRFITCHSYVQSEINMLMHVADSIGFTINTFTHILEGYKVAKKMKEHGAGGSTFSDWWAYKFEVNEAIPYNATILNNKGVITAINSDDAEMGRRLNQEAAKAIKYGGTSEEDAWKMITLNPAILLHLDERMGSLKVGKDADVVIWSENPLSVYSKVESTYVDGRLLFSLEENKSLMERDMKEKMRIIKKIGEDKKNKETQEINFTPEKIYHCETIDEYK